MTGNPFKPQIDMPPEAHDAALEEYRYYMPPGNQDCPLPPSKRKQRSLWIVAATATVGMMFFNFVFVLIMEAVDEPGVWMPGVWSLLVAMGIGGYFAQFASLSTFLVFAALPFWQRLGLHWLLAVALVSASLLGFQILGMGPGWRDAFTIFSCLPLLALAVQLPLWVMRFYFQWQIVREGDLRSSDAERPLSISDLLIATAVVALSVASARASPEAGEDTYWLDGAIIVLEAVAMSLVSIPPLLVWTLRVKAAAWGALAIWGYATAFAIVVFVLTFIFETGFRRSIWMFVYPCGIFGFAAALSAPFWLLRARGYQLKIGRDVS